MAEHARGLSLMPWLAGLLALLLLAASALHYFGAASTGGGAAAQEASELAALTQRIPRLADRALGGNADAFALLAEADRRLGSLRPRLAAQPALAANAAVMQRFAEDVRVVLDGEKAVLATRNAASAIGELVPQLLNETGTLLAAEGSGRLAMLARHLNRLQRTGDRLWRNVASLAAGDADLDALLGELAADDAEIGETLEGLRGAPNGLGVPALTSAAAQDKLRMLQAMHRQLSEQVRQVLAMGDTLLAVQQADRRLAADGDALYGKLSQGFAAGPAGGALAGGSTYTLALLGAALLVLLLLVWLYQRAGDIREVAARHAAQNERNQQAILRLLDELSNLADGDLTVQATVTEDITGAIADSINYAIEALRELVTTINDSAIMVDAAAKQTEATAAHMAKASEQQSQQIVAATDSVAQIARSIEEVSGNAERSSDVARHSVDVAHKGGDAVRRTIEGMNTIRETIQETSKRIKRLGESSQEIGNIVELINDIAEQTNILALNASIQASMAGEAGRGFAVVADEVQRLAERSANATKQIEVLVRTIQSDTNEAVVSMERSTTDVVGGALLAENAGAALEEIEQVSNQIASLVQNISGSGRQLATAANDINRNMSLLREISSQTAESTSATSTSISKLAELATQLRTSVSGFRLPDFDTGTAVLMGRKRQPASPPQPKPGARAGAKATAS